MSIVFTAHRSYASLRLDIRTVANRFAARHGVDFGIDDGAAATSPDRAIVG